MPVEALSWCPVELCRLLGHPWQPQLGDPPWKLVGAKGKPKCRAAADTAPASWPHHIPQLQEAMEAIVGQRDIPGDIHCRSQNGTTGENVICHRRGTLCLCYCALNLFHLLCCKGPHGPKMSVRSFPMLPPRVFRVLGLFNMDFPEKLERAPVGLRGANNSWKRVQPHQATGGKQLGDQSSFTFSLKTSWRHRAAQCGSLWAVVSIHDHPFMPVQ